MLSFPEKRQQDRDHSYETAQMGGLVHRGSHAVDQARPLPSGGQAVQVAQSARTQTCREVTPAIVVWRVGVNRFRV
jgi:hypothetical protein